MKSPITALRLLKLLLLLSFALMFSSCAIMEAPPIPRERTMLTTGYCNGPGCGIYVRGSGKYLWLNFWDKYYKSGHDEGRPYNGLTASGTTPQEPQPGLFSEDSFERPWMIPLRLVLFPWYGLPADGTIAADTRYYPFGTRMYIPGYGWGTVEDRGGAIRGPGHIDLFFDNYDEAMQWGRRRLRVLIERP